MKIKITLIALSLSICSLAVEIPEAKELHSEKHTVQFVVAELSADIDINAIYNKDIYKNFAQLTEKEKWDLIDTQKKTAIDQIKKSDSKISILATINLSPGEEFSDKNGKVVCMLDSESNTLDILKIKLPNLDESIIKPLTIDAKPNDWFTMFVGGNIINGKPKNYCLLVKVYPPTK